TLAPRLTPTVPHAHRSSCSPSPRRRGGWGAMGIQEPHGRTERSLRSTLYTPTIRAIMPAKHSARATVADAASDDARRTGQGAAAMSLDQAPPVAADSDDELTKEKLEAEGLKFTPQMTLSERAEELEEHMMKRLSKRVAKSVLFTSGDLDPTKPLPPPADPR